MKVKAINFEGNKAVGVSYWKNGTLINVIANKEVYAPWTDWKGNTILCPLVE